MPLHSRLRFGLAAVLATPHESIDAVRALMEGTNLSQELADMPQELSAGGKRLALRHFVMGDHMCMWPLLGGIHSCAQRERNQEFLARVHDVWPSLQTTCASGFRS